MTDSDLYAANVIEAAAMELYQRDSKLLADTFASLTPDTLAAIAAGTAPAPEGIRLAAKRLFPRILARSRIQIPTEMTCMFVFYRFHKTPLRG